jgi:hypothetical protein
LLKMPTTGMNASQLEQQRRWLEQRMTFKAEVGPRKECLAISPTRIRWRERHFSLEKVCRIRYGGVSHRKNEVSSTTEYSIGFGDRDSFASLTLTEEPVYKGFSSALWHGVGTRLVLEALQQLRKGEVVICDGIAAKDDVVIMSSPEELRKHVILSWADIQYWDANGRFFIGSKSDRHVYASASYRDTWNAHVLQAIVRGPLRKGCKRLSDFLRR